MNHNELGKTLELVRLNEATLDEKTWIQAIHRACIGDLSKAQSLLGIEVFLANEQRAFVAYARAVVAVWGILLMREQKNDKEWENHSYIPRIKTHAKYTLYSFVMLQ